MTCCGHQRQYLFSSSPPAGHSIHASPRSLPSETSTAWVTPDTFTTAVENNSFEYMGKTSLTIIGPYTWRHYHFTRPGAILEIDAKDAQAIVNVPHLRKIL